MNDKSLYRDDLWGYYVEFRQGHEYLLLLSASAKRTSRIWRSFLVVTSAGSVVTLSIWEKLHALWSVIAIASAITQALEPTFQSEKIYNAVEYILHDSEEILRDIELHWQKFDNEETSFDVPQYIKKCKEKRSQSFNRFADGLRLPEKKRLHALAEKKNAKYMAYHYNVKGDTEDAKSK